MKKILLSTLVIISLQSESAKGNDSLKIESVKLRIEKLEGFERIRDEKFDNQLELLKDRNELQIREAKQELKDEVRPIKWALGAVAILALLAVGAFFYQMMIGIKKIAEKQLKRTLQYHLKDNTDTILSLIKSQQGEDKLKDKKKLITLSSSEESANKIDAILKKMGFQNVNSFVVNNYEKFKDVDLIIFNNCAKDFSSDLIFEYLKKSNENDLFICFYPDYMKMPDDLSKEKDRINFANKNYTLYHQIMQTLTFQEMLEV